MFLINYSFIYLFIARSLHPLQAAQVLTIADDIYNGGSANASAPVSIASAAALRYPSQALKGKLSHRSAGNGAAAIVSVVNDCQQLYGL